MENSLLNWIPPCLEDWWFWSITITLIILLLLLLLGSLHKIRHKVTRQPIREQKEKAGGTERGDKQELGIPQHKANKRKVYQPRKEERYHRGRWQRGQR